MKIDAATLQKVNNIIYDRFGRKQNFCDFGFVTQNAFDIFFKSLSLTRSFSVILTTPVHMNIYKVLSFSRNAILLHIQELNKED